MEQRSVQELLDQVAIRRQGLPLDNLFRQQRLLEADMVPPRICQEVNALRRRLGLPSLVLNGPAWQLVSASPDPGYYFWHPHSDAGVRNLPDLTYVEVFSEPSLDLT